MEAKRANNNTANKEKDSEQSGVSTANGKKSEKDQNTTKNNKPNGLDIFNSIVATLTLLAVIYYACIAHSQLTTMQYANALTVRPYIGQNDIVVRYISRDTGKGNAAANTTIPTSDTVGLGVIAEIKNFGPVPGIEFSATWRWFIDGNEKPSTSFASTPSTLFPGQITGLKGSMGGQDYKTVMSNGHTFIIQVTIRYDGPTGHDEQCDKSQFNPAVNGFFDLGKCTL